MIDTEEREIEGLKVSVTQFPGRFGNGMKIRLFKIFGPVIGELFSGVKGTRSADGKVGLSKADLDLSKISGAIQKLFEHLDEESSYKLQMDLMQSTRVDGKEMDEAVYNDVFAGNYGALYKILFFVIEFNFKSVFGKGDIGKVLKGLMTQTRPVSPAS